MSKNAESKDFQKLSKSLSSPATLHESVSATTQRLFTSSEGYPRAFFCQADGTLVLKDAAGTSVSYTVKQSQIIPFENATELVDTTDIAVVVWW